VLPLETGMQIEVHYVWPTQFLIDCAVRLKTAGVHLRCVGSARQRLQVQRNCGGTTQAAYLYQRRAGPSGIDRDWHLFAHQVRTAPDSSVRCLFVGAPTGFCRRNNEPGSPWARCGAHATRLELCSEKSRGRICAICAPHFSIASLRSAMNWCRWYTAATPEIVPDWWLRILSATWGATPKPAIPDTHVRRRS
jgi:hypothetical protein